MGNTSSSHSRSSTPGSTTPSAAPGGGPSSSSSASGGGGGSTLGHFTSSLTKKARERSHSSATASCHGGHGAGSSSAPPAPSPNERVDGGQTVPVGLYHSAADFAVHVVRQKILDRQLAPFYPGLEDHEDDWAEDDIVQAIRESRAAVATKAAQLKAGDDPASVSAVAPKMGPAAEGEKRDASWYRGEAAECPLCFLYYPSNINTSRCCDQPICTECFVQIKRADATATHLESEPACCPFCMEPNFGIVYTRPKPRVETSSFSSPCQTPSPSALDSDFGLGGDPPSLAATASRPSTRRKSVNHTAIEVVTIDEIRPDWEAKLEAIKAVAARRANRRIVMRQVGDRLIPVGITSSRTPIQPLQLGGDGGDESGSASGASSSGGAGRRRAGTNPGNGGTRRGGELREFLGGLNLSSGADIEELMMMEAMRLSLLEEDQRQARERAAAVAASAKNAPSAPTPTSTPTSTAEPPQPSSSRLTTTTSSSTSHRRVSAPNPSVLASFSTSPSAATPITSTDGPPQLHSGLTPGSATATAENPFERVTGSSSGNQQTGTGRLVDF